MTHQPGDFAIMPAPAWNTEIRVKLLGPSRMDPLFWWGTIESVSGQAYGWLEGRKWGAFEPDIKPTHTRR